MLLTNIKTTMIPVYPEGQKALFEKLGYSPAVRSGNFLFVAGQVGVGSDGKVVQDPKEQMRLAFQKVIDLVEAAGMTKEDIVEVKTFHVDMLEHEDVAIEVKKEFFPHPPFPAFTGLIEVKRLGMEGLLLEVAATAHVPNSLESVQAEVAKEAQDSVRSDASGQES